ncbi:MAG: ABC transporter permease [Candidatus Parabeggiatoa sp. nov. 1]|nr:MAG: ABC transporter permease [Gammaproteobacteria bacterium]
MEFFDIKLVILWTDGLLFLLTLLALFAIIYIYRNPYLRCTWREVFRSKIGISAFVVLMAYITTGLLDSFHFRMALETTANQTEKHYSGEVTSLLDIILGSLYQHQEKTYSAPFSAFQFTKENTEQPDGTFQRQYPRLEYGGSHLNEELSDKFADITHRTIVSIFWALAIWGSIAVFLTFMMARKNRDRLESELKPRFGKKLGLLVSSMAHTWRKIWTGSTDIPWNIALITTGILILSISWFAQMAEGYHIFGTDKVGNDVFYLAIKSIRTGLIVGTVTTLIMLPLAIILGIMAGYFRGWIDDVIQYLYTTLNSIPGVLLIAAAMLVLNVWIDNHPEQFPTAVERADIRLMSLCIILGLTSWIGLCRLLRGETLKLRELGYVQAAQVFGVSHVQIIKRHFLPNLMHIVLITVVLDFSFLVLAEAVLSYLGIGVDPTTASWGNMINAARLEMAREPVVWWSLIAAFVFMFGLVLAANLFSDAVRRAFDPRGIS